MTTNAQPTTATAEPDRSVLDVVLRAWRETLPGEEPDPAVSWEDAGADSLKSLQLMMRIEELLGRPAPIELLTADTTPTALAASLVADRTPRVTDTGRPSIALVPGLYGDTPKLAAFRQRCAGSVAFDPVALPGLEQPIAVLGDIDATARLVAGQLLSVPEAELPAAIAGFSFGGVVAVEVARLLRAAGRRVDLLVILDTIIDHSSGSVPQDGEPAAVEHHRVAQQMMRKRPPLRWLPRAARPLPGEDVLDYANRLAFGLLLRLGRLEAARRLHRIATVSPAIAYRRHKLIVGGVRMRALPRWYDACAPVAVPTLLVLTDEGRAAGSEAKWRRVCPELSVVEIGGGHFDLLDAGADRCVSAILAALADDGCPSDRARPFRDAA